MANGDEKRGRLADAALRLETALARFDELVAAAKRAPLFTRKQIERAARTMQDAADNQAACATTLQELAQALGEGREQNQRSADALTARAAEIQARAGEHDALTAGLREIATRAGDLNRQVQELGASAGDPTEIRAKIGGIKAALDTIVADSDELRRKANAAELSDVAREADSLHQTVSSARKKLAEVAPS